MSKRLMAVRAERDGVRAAIAQVEDGSVRADGTARDLTDEENAKVTDLMARDAELTRAIEELWDREQRNGRVAEIVSQIDSQENGLVRADADQIRGVKPGEYALMFLDAHLKGNPGALERVTAIHRASVAQEHAEAGYRASDVTTDLAGILPTPIVGDLVKFVYALRPTVAVSRELPMPASGKTFTRPRVTQRTTAGQQTEGSALSSQKMTVVSDTVTKTTQGGFVTLTEQDIDWTDPSFLQILFEDLAQSYAIQTDSLLAAAILAAGVTNKVTGYTPASSAWTVFYAKLVAAAQSVFTNAKQLPDTLFAAPDVWAAIVGYLDSNNRPVFPTLNPFNAAGGPMEVTNFNGSPLGLNLVVDPNFAAGACVVAASRYGEFFEQNKGLAQIMAPSTLTVDVAYRGYFATNVYANGFVSMQTA
jgi:hypothetical protein